MNIFGPLRRIGNAFWQFCWMFILDCAKAATLLIGEFNKMCNPNIHTHNTYRIAKLHHTTG